MTLSVALLLLKKKSKQKNEGNSMMTSHDYWEAMQNLRKISDSQLLEASNRCIKLKSHNLYKECEQERVRRIEWRRHGS